MNKNLTEIVCVIDNSGSMGMIKSDAIGGFNEFIRGQKEVEGEARVSVCLFNSKSDLIIDNEDISEVPELTKENYKCSGSTALNDALGEMISKVGQRIVSAKKEDMPAKVIFCVLTDGEENSSREYSTKQIKELITYRKKHFEWDFVFLAANQDEIQTAKEYNFDLDKTVKFDYSKDGIKNAYRSMNLCTTSLRSK